MAGRGIYWTDGTPYLFDDWCPPYYRQCNICKKHKNTVRHPYNIVDLNSAKTLGFVRNRNSEKEWRFKDVIIKVCLSCFEKHKFIRPTDEELELHIFKMRKKKLNNN